MAERASLADSVRAKIDEMRPFLERSGGALEFVGVEDGIAHVRFALTRPRSSRLVVSLQMVAGIERRLRHEVPGLRGVEAVNLPPYTELGWDQPSFVPVELPVPGGAPTAKPAPTAVTDGTAGASRATNAPGQAGSVRGDRS